MSGAALRYTDRVAQEQIVSIAYLDSQGGRVTRRVVPDRIWFGRTDWVPEPQWLLDAYDLDRCSIRTYPMRWIEDFTPDTDSGVPNRRPDSGAIGSVSVHG